MNEHQVLLQKKLKDVFGFDDYKNDLQKNAVESIYTGNQDVFLRMPSGFGKSLCYQLPIVAKDDALALVVVPTNELAQDQLEYLKSKNVSALFYHDRTPKYLKINIQKEILKRKKHNCKIIFISPQKCAQTLALQRYIKRNDLNVTYFVIDEAHCISKASKCYLSSYKTLAQLRLNYPNIPIITITSTANNKVKADIICKLKLKNVLTYSMPSFRKNIFYDTFSLSTLKEPLIHLKQFLEKSINNVDIPETQTKKNLGLIFCSNDSSAIDLAQKLNLVDVPTLAYHDALSIKEKKEICSSWKSGDVRLLTTANYLSPGTHIESLRCTVHWKTFPNFERYYQESGRAGHDGYSAFCRTYYSTKNEDLKNFCISKCKHEILSSSFDDPELNCQFLCDYCVNKPNLIGTSTDYESVIKSFMIKEKNSVKSLEKLKYSDEEKNVHVLELRDEMLATINYSKNGDETDNRSKITVQNTDSPPESPPESLDLFLESDNEEYSSDLPNGASQVVEDQLKLIESFVYIKKNTVTSTTELNGLIKEEKDCLSLVREKNFTDTSTTGLNGPIKEDTDCLSLVREKNFTDTSTTGLNGPIKEDTDCLSLVREKNFTDISTTGLNGTYNEGNDDRYLPKSNSLCLEEQINLIESIIYKRRNLRSSPQEMIGWIESGINGKKARNLNDSNR